MSLEVWFASVLTSVALLAIPGPTVLLVVSYVLGSVLAGRMRERFHRPDTLRLVHRIGGSCLIAAGLLTGITRRVG